MTTLCEARAETLQSLLNGKGEPHPFAAMFPPILPEDFDKLVEDIKKNGLLQPITVFDGKILDGNNRYRACMRVGVKPRFTELVEASDAQAKRLVISANIHRRHLSPDQRREIIAALIKADPSKSNRQIGEVTKTSHVTVGSVRTELETTGQIDQLNSTTGADGKTRKRKSKKPKAPGSGSGDKEKITYQKVTDAKTATNAYKLFEEHLLEALGELSEQSSFDHADEYAQATIEKLQEKLGELQPEEVEAA